MLPPRTVAFPLCILRTPAMIPSRVDLPTPSGPIKPIILFAGISRSTSASATALPYRWLSFSTLTTGSLASLPMSHARLALLLGAGRAGGDLGELGPLAGGPEV